RRVPDAPAGRRDCRRRSGPPAPPVRGRARRAGRTGRRDAPRASRAASTASGRGRAGRARGSRRRAGVCVPAARNGGRDRSGRAGPGPRGPPPRGRSGADGGCSRADCGTRRAGGCSTAGTCVRRSRRIRFGGAHAADNEEPMRYVQMYYGWLYGGPPTARAYVTRAATFLVVGVTGFVVVSGVANVVGGQGAADAWIDA